MSVSATDSPQRTQIAVLGMRCAACAQLIELRVKQLAGVRQCTIQTLRQRADIVFDPDLIGLQQIVQAIAQLGYGALPDLQAAGKLIEQEKKRAIWRLFLAGFAMMQIMMLALPAYLVPVPTTDGELTPDVDFLLKLASLLVTFPVVGFSALPFFKAAWRDIRNRHVGMDVPVAAGIATTFIASVWGTFAGTAVYYDSVVMFVFLLLAARMIEMRVHARSQGALKLLTEVQPMLAERFEDYPDHASLRTCPASDLQQNDRLLVPTGAMIAADGVVIDGETECDEALMTGESRPVVKRVGDSVLAGALNLGAPIVMQALKVGEQTSLSSLIGLMERAASEKPRLIQIADRYASRFLFAIMAIALASGLLWLRIDPQRALWVAVSVMVVTCPCALSLATPGVMSAAMGELAKHGVLLARGSALETLAKTTHIVFDKTGTLTEGRLTLTATRREREFPALASLVSAMTATSTHPVSRALREAMQSDGAIDTIFCAQIREIAGSGIEVQIDGLRYRLGSLTFAGSLHGQAVPVWDAVRTQTLCALADERGWLALFALNDRLRPEAMTALEALHMQGKQLILLSGDRQEVVDWHAKGGMFSMALGAQSPQQKHDAVKRLQQQGAIVAMVGDGMNDGPVLSLANVSIAMGQGAPITQARSDALLLSNRLTDLSHAFVVADKTMRLIRQNLWWATIYNVLAIPAAATGWLLPWHAALGMSLSSVLVVCNSLRLLHLKSPEMPPLSLAVPVHTISG